MSFLRGRWASATAKAAPVKTPSKPSSNDSWVVKLRHAAAAAPWGAGHRGGWGVLDSAHGPSGFAARLARAEPRHAPPGGAGFSLLAGGPRVELPRQPA